MTTTHLVVRIEQRREAVRECLAEFGLPLDTAYHEDLLNIDTIPFRSSKYFAFLILTYKRECAIDLLKRISDQPAGIVKFLRSKGFIFKSDPKKHKDLSVRQFEWRNMPRDPILQLAKGATTWPNKRVNRKIYCCSYFCH